MRIRPTYFTSFLLTLGACIQQGVPGEGATSESPGFTQESLLIREWDLVFDSPEMAEVYSAVVASDDEEKFASEKHDPMQAREKLAVFQRVSTGVEPVYSKSEAVDIAYCVSNTFTNKATVVADIANAARDWLQVANVRFRYVPAQDANCTNTNMNVDFAVLPTNFPGLAGCGASKMIWLAPGMGCPVGASLVAGVLLMQYGAIPSPATARGVLRHELGHVLGFRHEHPWAPAQGGCGEAATIAVSDVTGRRLTPYDQASVMHYPHCGGVANSDFPLTRTDGEGARVLYGMPAAWYVGVVI